MLFCSPRTLTLVGRRKLVVHHALDHRFDVSRPRVPRTVVHSLLVDSFSVCGMTGLQHVERPPHVSPRQLHQRLFAVACNLDAFGLDDMVQARLDLIQLQRVEAESCAARLDGLDDLVDVVTDDAEANVAGVLFDHCR